MEKGGPSCSTTVMMPTESDPEYRLQIDEWILDYLICSAIKNVLDDYKILRASTKQNFEEQAEERSTLSLQLVNCELFQHIS